MNAVLLAAGRGSRLLTLTDDRPKCLVALGGHPLLHWQLSALRAAGADHVAVVRGYLAHLLTGPFTPVENPRWAETHMVGSLLCAGSLLATAPCLVSYGDLAYPAAAPALLAASSAPLAVLYDVNWRSLWTARSADPLADAETFRLGPGNLITDIGRRPTSLDEVEGQYMGLLRFTPESFGWIQAAVASGAIDPDRIDMTTLLRRLIERGHPVLGIPWTGPWCEVDTQADLVVAEALVARGLLTPPVAPVS